MIATAVMALGFVLVIEGLAWMLAPSYLERLIEILRDMSPEERQIAGAIAVAIGLGITVIARMIAI